MSTLGRHPPRETPEQRYARIGAQKPPEKRLHRGVMGGTVQPAAKPQLAKIERKARQSIRDSARGEECTVRLERVCNHDPETTVWSHCPLNDAGHGMATKSLDLAGCYCCSACHDVVDHRVPRPPWLTEEGVLLAWFKGMVRSLVILARKGIV